MLRSPSIRILSFVILFLMAASMIVPLWSVIATSLTSRYDSLQPGIIMWPRVFSLQGYETLFNRLEFIRPFINTMIVTVSGTLLHVLLCSLAGYALAQEDLPGRRIIGIVILATLTIPSQVILVPLFVVFRQLHLLNTLLSLVISGLVSAFSILLMKSYFEQVPRSIIEAARLDGAGHFTLLKSFYFPLALPGIITVAAFEIVHRYNMFTEPLLFINNAELVTLQIALRSVVLSESGPSTNDFIAPNTMMAGIVLAIVPLVIFYALLQRYLLRGTTIGGVRE
jgi:ABC-type glycerol-3-phosphate transport system permease component